MGGDCLNVGCVPSKAVIRAARAWADVRRGRRALRRTGRRPEAAADFGFAMERMRRLRAGISAVDSAEAASQGLGVDVFLGDGRFVSPDDDRGRAASACASAAPSSRPAPAPPCRRSPASPRPATSPTRRSST